MLKDFRTERFDVIIQAGQSNAEGCGYGPVEAPFVPNDSIWTLNPDFTISKTCESVRENRIAGNFAFSFAESYMKKGLLAPDRKLLVILSAVGGTGFSDNRWKVGDDLYERLMQMIRTSMELNPENRAAVFLWHQGETDAVLNADYGFYFEHFTNLMSAVRKECRDVKLPFGAGDFVQDWKKDKDNNKFCLPVIKAISDVCAGDTYGRFVETDGLKSNAEEKGSDHPADLEDKIHFSRRSLYALGERYFDAFCEIIGKYSKQI
jgi:hypothetical protein